LRSRGWDRRSGGSGEALDLVAVDVLRGEGEGPGEVFVDEVVEFEGGRNGEVFIVGGRGWGLGVGTVITSRVLIIANTEQLMSKVIFLFIRRQLRCESV
jgi:hypothetical protein